MYRYRLKKAVILFLLVLMIIMQTVGCTNAPVINAAETAAAQETEQSQPSRIIEDSLHSGFLKKDMNVNVYIPSDYSEDIKYPVLYMIHGYTGNEDSWLGITDTADVLVENGDIMPLIIVMPDIENSYGINSSPEPETKYNNNFGRYEDYIIQELIPYIDAAYSTNSTREGRFIGGLSMGGHVALHLAFAYNDKFSKVGGHSPAIWFDGLDVSDTDYMMGWLYPTEEDKKQRDPLELATQKDLSNTKVYLDCGEEDEYKFYEGCDMLFDLLVEKGVESEYHLQPGKHDGEYWRSHLEEYMMFYGAK